MYETLFQTKSRLQLTFNFHIHCQVVLGVAENITQNKSFEKYKDTPASKVWRY